MCGIAGIVFLGKKRAHPYGPTLDKEYVDVFADMLVKMQSRGGDATGVFSGKMLTTPSTPGNVYMYKAHTPADTFVKFKKFDQAIITPFSVYDSMYMVGHTRGATAGSASNNLNNHPHRSGRVIGVHNGIINNYETLKSRLESNITLGGSCDSELIFALMNAGLSDGHSIVDSVCGTADVLSGWFACVAIDTDNYPEIVFFRKSAPLCFLYCKEDKALLFASTMECITSSIGKSKFAKKTFEEKNLPDGYGLLLNTLEHSKFEEGSLFSLAEIEEGKTDDKEKVSEAQEPGPPKRHCLSCGAEIDPTDEGCDFCSERNDTGPLDCLNGSSVFRM